MLAKDTETEANEELEMAATVPYIKLEPSAR